MADATEAPAQSRAAILRVLAVLFIAAAAFAGSAAASCGYLAFKSKPAPQTSSVLRGTTSVVTAIRDLAVLESAAYHMERVIDLRDRQAHLYGLFESEDAMLLVAAADVVAGVDLRTMRDGDVSFDAQRRVARVLLPPPSVLSARLDNDNTYVHTRKTDVMARRAETLETRARQEAERALRDAALDAGILARARDNTARTVRTLIQSLGFERVEVGFRSE